MLRCPRESKWRVPSRALRQLSAITLSKIAPSAARSTRTVGISLLLRSSRTGESSWHGITINQRSNPCPFRHDIFFRIGKNDLVVSTGSALFNAPNDFCEKPGCNIRNRHPDDSCTTLPQAGGHLVGSVAQRIKAAGIAKRKRDAFPIVRSPYFTSQRIMLV